MRNSKKWLVLVASLLVTACSSDGGGASKGSAPSIANKTLEESLDIYDDLRISTYKGNTSEALISKGNLAELSSNLLYHLVVPQEDSEPGEGPGDEPVVGVGPAVSISESSSIASVFSESIGKSATKMIKRASISTAKSSVSTQANFDDIETIDTRFECGDSGYVHVKGTLRRTEYGNYFGAVDLLYQNCQEYGITIDGPAAEYRSEDSTVTYFYAGTLIEIGSRSARFTGSVQFGQMGRVSNVSVTRMDTGEQFQLIDWRELFHDYYGQTYAISGDFYHAEHGFFSVGTSSPLIYDLSDMTIERGELLLAGSGHVYASLIFVDNDDVVLAIDLDGDDQLDEMIHATPAELIASDSNTGEFVAYVEPNYPPTYENISFHATNLNTTDSIEVDVTGTSDPEDDALTVRYIWKLNGLVQPDYVNNELPPLVAQKNQRVSVFAEINDGHNTTRTNEIALIVGDAPAGTIISGLPETIGVGDQLEFSVSVQDPDPADQIDPEHTTVDLVYGPDGMSIENGQVTWQPGQSTFGREQVFHFGFSRPGTDEITHSNIRVLDEDARPLIARSGIEVPKYEHSIGIGQFDDDPANEVLLTDSYNRVFTLEKSGDKYVQDWMYPYTFAGGRIQQIKGHDLNQDGVKDILVATRSAVYVIYDRLTQAQKVFETDEYEWVSAIDVVVKTDSIELAILTDEGLSTVNLAGTILFETTFSNGEMLLVGNVDADPSPEIVVDAGYVYDGSTYANEWYYGLGFGSKMTLLDVNADGTKEIFGGDYGNPSLYSVLSRSVLLRLSDTDLCSISSGNIDADPQDELLIGDCQWGDIRAYDVSTTAIEEKWSTDMVDHGSVSLTIGDTNSDGDNEVIWGTGISHSGADRLVIAEVSGETITTWSNTNPSQLSTFIAAGVANITPEIERAVFVTPRTDSGSGNQRFIFMDADGSIEISDDTVNQYNRGTAARTVDYDKDGYAELFMSTSLNHYAGVFRVLQLSDYSTEWSTEPTSLNQFDNLVVADMNGDQHEDVVVKNNNSLMAIDVYNEVLLWNSPGFYYTLMDLAVGNLNGGAQSEVIVGDSGSISVWSKDNSSGYVEISHRSIEYGCKRVVVGDVESDDMQDIFCVHAINHYTEDVTSKITRFNPRLEEVSTIELNGNVTDLLVEQTENPVKNLIVTTSRQNNYPDYQRISQISLVSSSAGHVIWSSPELVGTLEPHNLHFYTNSEGLPAFTFATSEAMFLTH